MQYVIWTDSARKEYSLCNKNCGKDHIGQLDNLPMEIFLEFEAPDSSTAKDIFDSAALACGLRPQI